MKNHIRDIYIILIIVMIGALVRFPIANVRDIDTSVLYDPDSYLYARLAEEFYEEPMSEWHFITYRADDPLMNTVNSENHQFITNLLPLIVAFICKIFKFLNIQDVIFYFNIFLCPLSAIPAYIFIKKYTNTFGGIVAGLSMSTSVAYFMHTMYGYFDTDALIMIFATTLMVSTIDNYIETNVKKQIVLSVVSIITVALFSVSWEIYYFYVAVASVISALILIENCILKYELNIEIPIATTIFMIMECFIISGKELFSSLIRGTTSFLSNSSNWPSEAKYISELESPLLLKGGLNKSFVVLVNGIVNRFGGIPLFAIFLLIFILLFLYCVSPKRRSAVDKNTVLISTSLIIWTLITLIILPSGIRYIQLFALPSNLIVGFGLGALYDERCNYEYTTWKKDLMILVIAILTFESIILTRVIFALCISLLILLWGLLSRKISFKKMVAIFTIIIFACPIVGEYRNTKSSQPYTSSEMKDAMEYIVDNTPKDSTIVSWWGIGYSMQYYTGRHVVADGGIYNGSYFYWLANVFTSSNEDLSIGICKMLQSGSLEAVKISEEYFGCEKDATLALKEILALDKSEAENLLINKYGLSSTKTKYLLEYSHPEIEGDIYLVMYDDLRSIMSVLAYYGLWDFENDIEYETVYNEKENKYKYPIELENSVVEKWLDNKNLIHFNMIYHNESVSILKVDK